MLNASWNVLVELAPWLIVGMGVAGALHGLLPAGFLKKHLRGRGGVFRAVILGVPLPLCSCSVIPTGIGLKKDGASKGSAIGFLISTPQTGVDSILITASFLGWPFAFFKLISAALTGLFGGLLTDHLSQTTQSIEEEVEIHERPSLREMVEHSISIVEAIWGWLVFGVLVSAAITTYLPNIGLTTIEYFGTVGAIFAVLLFSVPLYVCATASVPIAAALVEGGMPTGAALVFLMAGPATNIATIGAVHRTFGGKALSVYLGTIIIGSSALALFFDAFFESSGDGALMMHEHFSLFGEICAFALLTMFAVFMGSASRDFITGLKAKNQHSEKPANLELDVEGMTCQNCVRKLTNALSQSDRVTQVEVTLAPGKAIIYGDIEASSAREIVRKSGFIVP